MSTPLRSTDSSPIATSVNHDALLGDIPTLVDSLTIDPSNVPRKPFTPSGNPFDLAADANVARKSHIDEQSHLSNPQNAVDKHETKVVKKSIFFKIAFILFIAFIGLTLCLFALSMPWTKAWVDSHDVPPTLRSAFNYAQSMRSNILNESESQIRIADQHDPARSAPVNMGELSKDHAQIATFFAKKYRLAATEVEKYIHFAQRAAKAKALDTTLILAVMSIESNLNPITESPMGAQGLMQVLTAVHLDKLAAYGGPHTVFDPEVNIMVGATILADCIKLGGSLEMGLKCYVGATGPTDNGYGAKVLAEKERIEKAKLGVFDFAPNNKVLIDMGLIAANPEPIQPNNAATTLQSVNAIDRDRATQAAAVPVPTGTGAGTTAPPLIPATVTALPAVSQAATVLHNTSQHTVSGTVRQERTDALAAPHIQK